MAARSLAVLTAIGLAGVALATAVLPTDGAIGPHQGTGRRAGAGPATTTPSVPTQPTSMLSGPLPGATTPDLGPSPGPPDLRLPDLGSATQAVVVVAPAGASTATLAAYERTEQGWRRQFGPWPARVGRNGVADPGAKREGDGTTPSGTYAFEFFFGLAADPGVRFPYRPVTPSSVWNDDPASPRYNQWIDTALDGTVAAGASPEPMTQSPAYDYGAVIAYNAARTPYLGSAIFLHASTGGPTAGCVSLPVPELLAVLRWLDPARDPRIVIGTSASLGTIS